MVGRDGGQAKRWGLRRPRRVSARRVRALGARGRSGGLSHTRASLTIARNLARRSYHVLHQLGPAALDPIPTS